MLGHCLALPGATAGPCQGHRPLPTSLGRTEPAHPGIFPSLCDPTFPPGDIFTTSCLWCGQAGAAMPVPGACLRGTLGSLGASGWGKHGKIPTVTLAVCSDRPQPDTEQDRSVTSNPRTHSWLCAPLFGAAFQDWPALTEVLSAAETPRPARARSATSPGTAQKGQRRAGVAAGKPAGTLQSKSGLSVTAQ